MRKAHNYLLKSDFKTKTLRKLSTPKLALNLTEFSKNRSSYNHTLYSPQKEHTFFSPQKEKEQLTSKRSHKVYDELMLKFNNFFDFCDDEEREEIHQTNLLKDKMSNIKKDLRDLNKVIKNNTNKGIETNEKGGNDQNFNQFKHQTRFKKKILDILLNPIQNKGDLFFMYNKNQMIKDHIKKRLMK